MRNNSCLGVRDSRRSGDEPIKARKLADFEIIETKAGLAVVVEDLLSAKIVAIDTEADSFYHSFDKTCLVQIATRRNIYLIDPLALGGPAELAPLGPVFASPEITKIFHAAEYDLFVLTRDCRFSFANLFDTMVSAQLLGYPSVGLAGLAERHFGVNLPKDEQRSDWSRRPLTQRQLNYAAADVVYLIELTEKLTRELRQAKRLRWAREEFESLCTRSWPEREFDEFGYLRIKGAKRLDPKGLSILRELYFVRDARARELDRPPFKVLGNRTLLDIADRKPTKLSEVAEIKGITDLLIRRMGRDIMTAIRKGRKQDHGPLPKLGGGRRRMDRQVERRMAALKTWRTGRAEDLRMDPGVLAPNSVLEAIAWRAPATAADLDDLPELKGWFRREFGSEVTRVTLEDLTGQETTKKQRHGQRARSGRRRSGPRRADETES